MGERQWRKGFCGLTKSVRMEGDQQQGWCCYSFYDPLGLGRCCRKLSQRLQRKFVIRGMLADLSWGWRSRNGQ